MRADEELDVDVRPGTRPGDVELALRGDVCLLTAGRLEEALNAALAIGARRIVVDLADVDVFGAAGVTEVVRASATARATGATVLVRPGGSLHREVLEAIGLQAHLEPATLSS